MHDTKGAEGPSHIHWLWVTKYCLEQHRVLKNLGKGNLRLKEVAHGSQGERKGERKAEDFRKCYKKGRGHGRSIEIQGKGKVKEL